MKRLILAACAACLLLAGPVLAQSSPKLGGWLLREGHRLDVNLQNVVIEATSCQEPEIPLVTITVLKAPKTTAPGEARPAPEPLLCITADSSAVKTGEVILPETALDVECSTGRAPAVQVRGWTSPALCGPSASLPRLAWVQFTALKRSGPIDVRFEADFERFGRLTGHLVIAKTDLVPGRVPAPQK